MQKKTIFLISCALIALLPAGYSSSAEPTGVEYKLKAAYMLNFAKFMTWAENSADTTSFPLCIYGEDPFGPALSGVEEKSIRGQQVTLMESRNLTDFQTCKMVFVSDSERDQLPEIIEFFADKPVVLISDITGFVKTGGTIEFISIDNKLRFIINNSQARNRGVNITASLLKLAVEVM